MYDIFGYHDRAMTRRAPDFDRDISSHRVLSEKFWKGRPNYTVEHCVSKMLGVRDRYFYDGKLHDQPPKRDKE